MDSLRMYEQAESLALHGQLEQAAEMFMRLAEAKEVKRNPPFFIACRCRAGQCLAQLGQLEMAFGVLRHAAGLAKQQKSFPHDMVSAFYVYGNFLCGISEDQAAEEWLRDAAELASRSDIDYRVKLNAFESYARFLGRQGYPEASLIWSERAAELANEAATDAHTRLRCFHSHGAHLRDMGQTEAARVWLSRAAEIADHAAANIDPLGAFFDYGTLLRDLDEYEAAKPWLEKAAELVDQGGADEEDRMKIFFSHGSLLAHLGERQAACPWLEKAAKLAEQIAVDPYVCIDVFLALGNCLDALGKTKTALPWLEKAAKLAEQIAVDPYACIGAFLSLGECLDALGETKTALPWLENAAKLAQQPDLTPQAKAQAFSSLGRFLAKEGEYESARSWLRQAAEIVDVPGVSPKLSVEVFASYGQVLDDFGEYQAALRWLRRAAEQAERQVPDPHTRAIVFSQYGDALRTSGDFGAAGVWLKKAAEIARDQVADPRTRATLFSSYAYWLHHALGELETAKVWLQEAAKLAKTGVVGSLTEADILCSYGSLLVALGDRTGAQVWLQTAAELSRDAVRNPVTKVRVCSAYADFLIELGDIQSGCSWLESAVQAVKHVPNPRIRADVEDAQSVRLLKGGRWFDAVHHLSRTRDLLLESLRASPSVLSIALTLSLYRDVFDLGALVTEALWVNGPPSPGDDSLAWESVSFADVGKCVSICEGLRRSNGHTPETPSDSWRAEPADWRRLFNVASVRGGSAATDPIVRGVRGLPTEQEEQARDENLIDELPGRADEGTPTFMLALTKNDVEKLLPDCQTVLLTFHWLRGDLVAIPIRRDKHGRMRILGTPEGFFRINRSQAEIMELLVQQEGTVEVIVDENEKLHARPAIELRKEADLQPIYRSIYETLQLDKLLELLEPDPAERGNLHLVLIPDGLLYLLPLHAACAPDGSRLYEQVASVSYGLSLRTLDLQQQIATKRHSLEAAERVLRGVAFANPNGGSEPLAGVIDEVEALVEETGAEHWWLHGETDPAAVLGHHRRRHRSGNIQWHMGHGRAQQIKAGPMYRLVASLSLLDGPLTAARMVEDRYDLRGVTLVHFSACLLGRMIPLGGSKEIEGFIATLTLLGCRRMCSALWAISDTAAPHFARLWLRAIKEHIFGEQPPGPHSFAIAFKEALVGFRQIDRGRFDHEFFWAAYTLYGLG